jgi:hypothetical protein
MYQTEVYASLKKTYTRRPLIVFLENQRLREQGNYFTAEDKENLKSDWYSEWAVQNIKERWVARQIFSQF